MNTPPRNNNPVIKHKFTADPTVLEYKGAIFLYTGHDESTPQNPGYVMNEWLCFSSTDLVNWQEYPVPLRPSAFSWAKGDAYASKVIFYQNKFYWYAALTHGTIPGKAIAVATSDTPHGPFTDARGSALITKDMIDDDSDNFDPSVIIDNDGQPYIFWGKHHCYWAKMKKNMIELEGEIHRLDLPEFQEGAHIHYRNGWYYLSYGYGFPEKVAYVMSRSIHGPWTFCGILNDVPYNCETNRPCIVDFRGNTYFFYHNGALPGGGSHNRSVCIDYLHYNADGKIQKVQMTQKGVQPLHS